MSLFMQGISKAFSANRVLRDVNFALPDGQIRALIGENGAGKTTLMNILGGVLPADSGDILLDGRPVHFAVPRDSMDAGIAFIHQELNLVNDLTVYENMFLGRELKRPGGLLDAGAMMEAATKVLTGMGMDLDVRRMVRDLDASYKQVVEIARALLMRAKIIIMDEPTTSLTEVEIERVFALMRTLRAQGVSMVFISHKLGEVLEICDAYTVLRDGRVVAEGRTADVTERELSFHMVGHAVRTESLCRTRALGDVAMLGEGLSRERAFENVGFWVRYGEIVGFTGLLGDGRSELFRSIFTGDKAMTGVLKLSGKVVQIQGTDGARRMGIGYVPRNRKENGIVPDMSILHNESLATIDRLTRHGLIDGGRERAQCQAQIDGLQIKLGRMDDGILSLSGGNQQKVVLAKWLAASPKVIIFDNPTQGVDVGAKEEIYDIIGRLADAGVAVVVLSSEAQEIIRICDRAYVMYHGRIQGMLTCDTISEHSIMALATGGSLTDAPPSEAASESHQAGGDRA